jgi:hypothetical protein
MKMRLFLFFKKAINTPNPCPSFALLAALREHALPLPPTLPKNAYNKTNKGTSQ